MRSEFEKAFPIPGHWIVFNESLNKYHCPYAADYGASIYQAKWEAWQLQQSQVDKLHKQLINQGHRFNAQSQRIKDLEHKSGELKKQRDSFIKAYDIEIGTSLELQKRVDALKGLVIELKKLDMENGSIEITSEFVEEIICDFEQALKGDEDYIRAQCDMLGGEGEA